MSDTARAPGLVYRGKEGQYRAYWIAQAKHVRAGYEPKCVRLHGSEEQIAARCHILQAEMLQWAGGKRAVYDGTVASLINLYQTDPDSPWHDLRQSTQSSYAKILKRLIVSVGERRIANLAGMDVKRWYRTITGSASAGYAYLTVNVFKVVLNYGSSRRIAECTQLRQELRDTKFSAGSSRKVRLSYEQVWAFRDEAHRRGRHSMALGITLQYELALRQRDVIGEWIREEVMQAENSTSTVATRPRLRTSHPGGAYRRWQNGLTWSSIGQDGILRKATTKTGADAEHRISEYPDLVAELARTDGARRIGPLIISETNGLPYDAEQYRRQFRKIARAAGIPDDVWNMDARAGAVTEAYEAGAQVPDAMALATHTTPSVSRRYNRGTEQATSRVARLRVQSRKD